MLQVWQDKQKEKDFSICSFFPNSLLSFFTLIHTIHYLQSLSHNLLLSVLLSHSLSISYHIRIIIRSLASSNHSIWTLHTKALPSVECTVHWSVLIFLTLAELAAVDSYKELHDQRTSNISNRPKLRSCLTVTFENSLDMEPSTGKGCGEQMGCTVLVHT